MILPSPACGLGVSAKVGERAVVPFFSVPSLRLCVSVFFSPPSTRTARTVPRLSRHWRVPATSTRCPEGGIADHGPTASPVAAGGGGVVGVYRVEHGAPVRPAALAGPDPRCRLVVAAPLALIPFQDKGGMGHSPLRGPGRQPRCLTLQTKRAGSLGLPPFSLPNEFRFSGSEPGYLRCSRRSRGQSCDPANRPPHTSPAAGRDDTWCRPSLRAAPA